MDGLSLKDALAIAARYADPKGADRGLHVVVLRDGVVRATNHVTGCEIPCPDVAEIDLAVDCAALRRMVGAIGEGVKLSKAKGRKLMIKGAGVQYTLQAVAADSEPSFPEVPKKGGWTDVSKHQVDALRQIASVVDPNCHTTAFQGLRLTPTWCGASTSNTVAFAWIDGLVDAGFTSPPHIFEDLVGDAQLLVEDTRLYLRSAKSGAVQWSLGLDAPYPEESIAGALVDSRSRDRTVAAVKLTDLALLCKQAAVVAESKVQAFKLELDGGHLTLNGKQGVADFSGKVPVEDVTAAEKAEAKVGIEVARIAQLAGVVAAAGGAAHYIAIAGPLAPVMMWNHGAPVTVETLTMPMRLE